MDSNAIMVIILGIYISLLSIGNTPNVFAQEVSTIPGSFVDVGFGTRPVAMGYAFVGLADDKFQ